MVETYTRRITGDANTDWTTVEDISHLPRLLAGVLERGVGRICNGDFYITQLSCLDCGLTGPHLCDVFAVQFLQGSTETGSGL